MRASIMSSHLRCRPAALSPACKFERNSLACLRTTLVMFTLRPSLSLCSSALPSQRWVGEEEGVAEKGLQGESWSCS